MRKKVAVLLVVLLLFSLPVVSSALSIKPLNPGLIITTLIPAAPTNLSAPFGTTQGSTALYFSWNDNSSNETGFIISRRGINQLSWTEAGRVGAGVTTFGDTGLLPSTTYVYSVTAYNSSGTSGTTNFLELTTNALLTILTPNGGEVINGGSVYNITWAISGDHNSPIGGDMAMSLYYSVDGQMSQPINMTSVSAGDGSYLWTVPRISSSSVEVSAKFSAGPGQGYITDTSDSKFTIQTRGLSLTPIAPSHLSGYLLEPLKAYIEWDQSETNKVGFTIERKTGTGPFEMISINKANEYNLTNGGLLPGTTYTYRVSAYNGFGDSAFSNEVKITTAPLVLIPIKTVPLAPLNLAARVLSFSEAILTWTAADANATGFKLERKTATGSFSEIASLGSAITSYSDKTLSPETDYTYQIKAFNTIGNSLYSNSAKVKTPILVPPTEPFVVPGELIGASTWAEPEIKKAIQYALTTNKILNNFQKSITREEFCEIAVKLYESLSGQTAAPISPNPFKDTVNSEILKANRLGIVFGTSSDTFSPTSPVTRQEISVMLLRTMKVAQPGLDYSVTGSSAFADQQQISSWALDAIRYMNSIGIMKGTGNNNVSPLGNTSREQGIALVLRTYEEFK